MAKKEARLKKDYDIAMDFATKVYKQFREVIKSVVLFGSIAKTMPTKKSDIDLIIIVDDCTVQWDTELIAWYREELGKLIAKQKYRERIHINTVTLSTFWDELKAGEPLIINVIRYGQPLIDYGGFFDPLKVLLAKGRIRPTPEAVFTTMQRADQHLWRANNSILASVEGFYWATVDASHSALMAINVIPPSPEYLGELLTQFFVKKKKLSKKYIDIYEEIRKQAKGINYGEIKHLKGSYIEELQKKSDEYVKTLRNISQMLIRKEKIIKIEPKEI